VYGGLDILVNNVGAVALRLEGFSSVTDDQWLTSLNLKFHGGREDNPRGAALDAREGERQHHHGQLGECVPSRSRDHRLLRREGGADEFLEGAVQGGGSARDSP
jgi:NAD(P)-dependent dehydrogenase (short-subunit alcohol dehydrogenase family)